MTGPACNKSVVFLAFDNLVHVSLQYFVVDQPLDRGFCGCVMGVVQLISRPDLLNLGKLRRQHYVIQVTLHRAKFAVNREGAGDI